MKYQLSLRPRAQAQRAKGFTLLEFLVVTTIITIIAMVAIPIYSDYKTRAQLSEVMVSMTVCRNDVIEWVQMYQSCPTEEELECRHEPTKFVAALDWDGSKIVATVSETPDLPSSTHNSEVYLEPKFQADFRNITSWSCGGGIDDEFLPAHCRTSL